MKGQATGRFNALRFARIAFGIAYGAGFGAIAVAEGLPVAPGPTGGPYPGFEVRYGRYSPPGGQDLSLLIEKPMVIGTKVQTFIDEGTKGKVLEALGDCQAIYDLPIAAIAAVLEVDAKQAKYGAGLLDAHIDLKSGNRTIVYQELGTLFLGIRVSYLTRSEVFRDELPDGVLGFRARLIESMDGKLYESFSSWYLEPIVVDGRKLTYVRTFMHAGIRNPFLGAESIMRAFIPKQSSDMMSSNIKEARRRLAGK